MLIRGARVFMGDRFEAVEVRVHNGAVQELGHGLVNGLYEDVVDLAGDYLLPGFVDTGVRSAGGHSAMQGERAIRAMSRSLYRAGVAAFCPVVSGSASEIADALTAVGHVMARQEAHGARVLGANVVLEGAVDDVAALVFTQAEETAPSVVRVLTMRAGNDEARREAALHGIVVQAALDRPVNAELLAMLIHQEGLAPVEAVRRCTTMPADMLSERLAGRIQPGTPAPLTQWTPEWRFVRAY